MAARLGSVDVLPQAIAQIPKAEAILSIQTAHGIRGGAEAILVAVIAKGLNEAFVAPEEAGVDGVKSLKLFSDRKGRLIEAQLRRVWHIEDLIELAIDDQYSFPPGVFVVGKAAGEVIKEARLKEMVAHGQPEGLRLASAPQKLGASEYGPAIWAVEVGVMSKADLDALRRSLRLDRLAKRLRIVARDDAEASDAQMCKVFDMALQHRLSIEVDEKLMTFPGCQAAAKARSQDNRVCGGHKKMLVGNQRVEKLCFPPGDAIL